MHKPQYVTHKKFRWEFADTTATPSEIAAHTLKTKEDEK